VTTFLFWNIKKRPLGKLIADIVEEHSVDIVFLAECHLDEASNISSALREKFGNSAFHHLKSQLPIRIKSESRLIETFSRFPDSEFPEERVAAGNRASIRHLKKSGQPDILVSIAHLPDPRNSTKYDQNTSCNRLAASIFSEESRLKHRRTVLIGDLNLNPFDDGVVAANALNASFSERIVKKARSRHYEDRDRPFFFNPMWRFFKETEDRPQGTYYFNKSSEGVLFYWYIFDQVLIRPELLDQAKEYKVEILTQAGKNSLLTKNGLPSRRYSDHLPILFAVDFK
jgi:hypothetical protein